MRAVVQRVRRASVRVDGILVKVDKLLGSGETSGVMADARETLKSFKQVADTLNARLGTITDNLFNLWNNKREMRARQHDAVHPFGQHGVQRVMQDLQCFFSIEITFFNLSNQTRASALK